MEGRHRQRREEEAGQYGDRDGQGRGGVGKRRQGADRKATTERAELTRRRAGPGAASVEEAADQAADGERRGRHRREVLGVVTFGGGEGDDVECSQGDARPEQGCRQGAQTRGTDRAEPVRAGAGRLPRAGRPAVR